MSLHTDSLDDSQSRLHRLRRLSWRVRRGMLENDLLLSRFFEQSGSELTEAEIEAVDVLLDLSDDVLLKVFLVEGNGESLDKENIQLSGEEPEKQKVVMALIQKITMSRSHQKGENV